MLLVVENDVNITFGWVSNIVFAGPLHLNRSKLFEGVGQRDFSDVPGNTSQKHLARICSILVGTRWQMTAPSASRVAERSRVAVHPGCTLQVAVAIDTHDSLTGSRSKTSSSQSKGAQRRRPRRLQRRFQSAQSSQRRRSISSSIKK